MKRSYAAQHIRANPEDRTAQFVISDGSRDRHGTVLNMDNWKLDNFNRNGIVGYQHDVYGSEDPDPDRVIGKGRAWLDSKDGRRVLMGEVEFEPPEINELAEKVFQKVKHGTLNATSVGFNPIEDDKGRPGTYRNTPEGNKTFYYHGQELLEFSIVNIPSNPNALKRHLTDQAYKPPVQSRNIALEKAKLELEKQKIFTLQ